ncbi:MAG: tetratricopeptide repeat protein [Nitrospinae bacterium]|nr:tetratricopeptide repeat protein [Nitrospinota bacterium]
MTKIIHKWEIEQRRDIKRLRTELEKNPQSPELHLELGKALLRVFSPDMRKEGIQHIEKSIRLKPEFAEAIELLANMIMEENPVRGSRLAKKAATIYTAKGEDKRADRILNYAAMHYVYDGWEFLDAHDPVTAKKKAQRALNIYPYSVDARNILASIHMDRFEFKDAERIYNEAISDAIAQQGGKIKIEGISYWGETDTRPYMRARHGLGLCYINLGRFQDALKEFETLLDLNPDDNQGIRFLLADVYFYLGDKKGAEKYYKKYGGAYNYALFLFSTGERTAAINLLKESIKTESFIAILLKAYLKMFEFWKGRGIYKAGEAPPMRMHCNAAINAWNENIGFEKDYITSRNLESAYDYCNLFGPLWLREDGSYMFLLEGMNAAE